MTTPTRREALVQLRQDIADHLGDQIDPEEDLRVNHVGRFVEVGEDALRMLFRQASAADAADVLDESLDVQARLRLLRVMSTTPFAGAVMARPNRVEEVTAASVTTWLEELSGLLRDFFESRRALEAELAALKRDVAGARRLFGLGMEG